MMSLRTKIATTCAFLFMIGGPLISYMLRMSQPGLEPVWGDVVTIEYVDLDMGKILFLIGIVALFLAAASLLIDRRQSKQDVNPTINPR